MKKLSVLLALFCLVASPVFSQILFNPEIKRIAVFKNGYVFTYREGETPTANGWAYTTSVPIGVMGTVWGYSNSPNVKVKQLLASEEKSGVLSVEEQGNRTLVTLLAQDLFPSGSATVIPAYEGTIRGLTVALNKVPGRVLVVGHTDDQRIRSLRYQDNFELSRERAVSVVGLLQGGIDNRARLSWTGVGASEPRYRPESDPENRSRNRRVEIIHMSGT